MEKQRTEKKQTGRVNYVWVLAGGYLLYTSFKLIRGLGESGHLLISIGSAALFAAVGGWLLWREWKAYRYGMEHMDDPETWSDEPQEALPEEREEDV